MNKAAIALALVAAIAVGVVSANKLSSHRVHKDSDFEPENQHLSHFDHEGQIEDDDQHHRQRHHGNHHGNNHGSHHGLDHDDDEHRHRHGIRKHIPIVKSFHGKGNSKNSKRGQLRGVGGAGVGVAAGNFRDHEGHSAGIEKNTRLADRKSIQGKKGFVAGEKKGLEADFQHHNDNDNAGIHKHQFVNKNKVFIKDQVTGVNDVDGFRNSREDSDSGHLAASEGKFVAGGASGKITNDKEFERDVKAGHSSDESSEGAGFVAGAGIGGAGESF